MPLVHRGDESAVNAPLARFERHHHTYAYAALVVRGSCDEAGDRGRFRATAGDVLVHAAYDGHGDAIGRRGAEFINIVLDRPLEFWCGRVRDLDRIVRMYERNIKEAAAALHEEFEPACHRQFDWPDLLARDLSSPTQHRLHAWAERHGLHPASVSRGFRLAYGVSPKRFRLERMASEAARKIKDGSESLGEIAAACGFADQPHMNRALVQLFGTPPATIRNSG